MDFEEDKKYETKSSSDYWADVVKGTETYGEEEEENTKKEPPIFMCSNCGFMYDFASPPKNYLPFDNYIYKGTSDIKCPKCGKKVEFKTVSREKYNELVKKAKIKKEEQEDKKLERIKKRELNVIKEEMYDLADDLKERLLKNEISTKRFAFLFTFLAKEIIRKNGKNVGSEITDLRKIVYSLSDKILEIHEEAEKTEDILEEFNYNIEEDELYKAQLSYYIEDDKFAIPEYELSQRIEEYGRLEKKIAREEYEKEIEEKYQERKAQLLEKAEERSRRKKLRDIM